MRAKIGLLNISFVQISGINIMSKYIYFLVPLALMLFGCEKQDAMDMVMRGNYFTRNWMAEISDDKLLSDLSIPGTHDSGSKNIGNTRARTQNFTIEEQLDDGIRFLDIRLRWKGSFGYNGQIKHNLGLFHGDNDCGVSFDQVLDWIKTFLSYHPNEVILMSIKNEKKGEDISEYLSHSYFGDERWKDLFYTGNCIERLPTLGEVRGKIIVFKRFEHAQTIPHFIDWYTDWDGAGVDNKTFMLKNTHLNQKSWYYIEDEYKEYDTGEKLKKVKRQITGAVTGNAWDFFLTFVSIAPNPMSSHTPFQYAWGGKGTFINPEMNSALTDFIWDLTPGFVKRRFGVVALDYYNKRGDDNDLVSGIIMSNFSFPLD